MYIFLVARDSKSVLSYRGRITDSSRLKFKILESSFSIRFVDLRGLKASVYFGTHAEMSGVLVNNTNTRNSFEVNYSLNKLLHPLFFIIFLKALQFEMKRGNILGLNFWIECFNEGYRDTSYF